MQFSESLKKNEDFVRVYRNGRSKSDRLLVLYVRKNGTARSRVGISVSKKVGNSVVRHRIRRLIRENYRLNESIFRPGYDLVVIARNPSEQADFYDIRDSLLSLGRRQGVVEDRNHDEKADDLGNQVLSEVHLPL